MKTNSSQVRQRLRKKSPMFFNFLKSLQQQPQLVNPLNTKEMSFNASFIGSFSRGDTEACFVKGKEIILSHKS